MNWIILIIYVLQSVGMVLFKITKNVILIIDGICKLRDVKIVNVLMDIKL